MSIGFCLMAETCAHKKKYKILKKISQKKTYCKQFPPYTLFPSTTYKIINYDTTQCTCT